MKLQKGISKHTFSSVLFKSMTPYTSSSVEPERGDITCGLLKPSLFWFARFENACSSMGLWALLILLFGVSTINSLFSKKVWTLHKMSLKTKHNKEKEKEKNWFANHLKSVLFAQHFQLFCARCYAVYCAIKLPTYILYNMAILWVSMCKMCSNAKWSCEHDVFSKWQYIILQYSKNIKFWIIMKNTKKITVHFISVSCLEEDEEIHNKMWCHLVSNGVSEAWTRIASDTFTTLFQIVQT